ncbi:MAG: aminoglycoside phosphotransferase family protein [Gemmatimonadetes bacterium]|nr:aminoglycoside phosphotransferase family protein [Gemmatimonadota bacterium]MYG17306.1 aminoglycoside phosphotransferase family protein [Gemmatimonadota bacterium]
MASSRKSYRGALHVVERIGDTVRRPVSQHTPAVHGLLRYLEDTDFQGVPRLIGADDEYETLSWIEGEPGTRPWPEVLRTGSGLIQLAGFLKSYHVAVKDYIPTDDTGWCVPDLRWQPGLIIRHGDLGPWNTIWSDDVLQGIIDWDLAEPGKRIEDVAQIAWHLVPLRGNDFWSKAGFEEPPDYRKRLNVLCEAYGGFRTNGVIRALLDLQETEILRISTLGSAGVEPWCTYLRRGDLEVTSRERDWLRTEHSNLV